MTAVIVPPATLIDQIVHGHRTGPGHAAQNSTPDRPAAKRQATSDSLLPAHIAMFAKHRTPVEILQEARIKSVDNWAARRECGIWFSLASDCGGIWFPTFDPTTGYCTTGRVRRDHPEINADGKPENKYLCPYGNSQHLYMPPWAAERLKNPDTIIILVEAEKSALALEAFFRRMTWSNMLALAMGGCYGWRSKRARSWLAPNGEWQRIPGPVDDLKYCNGRTVFIMLDSNVHTNRDVERARVELVVELNKAYRNCTVRVCDLAHAG